MTAALLAGTSKQDFMQLSAALAMEIASGMTKPSEVFARYGYSKQEITTLLQNPTFQTMLREAKANWGADANAEERIKLKAKLALEELLHPHYLLAVSPDTPAAARNEAVKTFERLSGMAKQDAAGGATGERFVVNINLGDDRRVTIDAPVMEEITDGD